MIIIEDQIHDWQKSVQPLRDQVVNDCLEIFFAELNDSKLPASTTLAHATQKVQAKATLLLTTDAVLSNLPNSITDPRSQAALRTSWQSLLPPWPVPAPTAVQQVAPWRAAVAGALGSLLGSLAIGWLMEWLLDLREAGLLLGALIGAAGLVYAFGFAMQRITAHPSFMARVIFHPTAHYDRQAYTETLRLSLAQWIDYGLLLLHSLTGNEIEVTQQQVFDADLARAIVNLHSATVHNLALEAESILREARRLGLQGLESPPRFLDEEAAAKAVQQWDSELAKKYRGFGVIEPGDRVVIIEEPIMQDDVLLAFGQVRKVRQ